MYKYMTLYWAKQYRYVHYLFLGRYVSKHLTEFIHFDFNEVINDWALYTTM